MPPLIQNFTPLKAHRKTNDKLHGLGSPENKIRCGFKAIVTSALVSRSETKKVNLNAS